MLVLAVEPTFLSRPLDLKIESLKCMFFGTFQIHVAKMY